MSRMKPLGIPSAVRPRRPIGVTVLTILQVIGGIGDVLIGILLILAVAVVSLLGGSSLATALLLLAWTAFGLGILSFVLAYGLWTGKGWAWGLSVIGAVIGLCLGVLGLVVGGLTVESLIDLVPIILYVLILAYLYTRNVRAFFGRIPGIVLPPPIIPPAIAQPYPPPQPPYQQAVVVQQPIVQQPQYQPAATAQPTPLGPSTCPNCGNQLEPGVNFCDRCGTRLR